jgi:hypothetical protein
MKDQKQKSFLSQFGEFAVAAELNRRQFYASVTYGNQKSMDIIALSDHGHYAIIEVKTSDKNRFPTGLSPSKQKEINDRRFWVFVKTKLGPDNPETEFYVLSDQEIKSIQSKRDKQYFYKYKLKHRKEFKGKGVPNVTLEDIESHKDCWDKIHKYLNKKLGQPAHEL